MSVSCRSEFAGLYRHWGCLHVNEIFRGTVNRTTKISLIAQWAFSTRNKYAQIHCCIECYLEDDLLKEKCTPLVITGHLHLFTGSGDVSIWVNNSRMRHKSPNKQRNKQQTNYFRSSINIFRNTLHILIMINL